MYGIESIRAINANHSTEVKRKRAINERLARVKASLANARSFAPQAGAVALVAATVLAGFRK